MLNLKKKRQTFFKEYFVMNCTKCLLQVNQYDANYKVFAKGLQNISMQKHRIRAFPVIFSIP